MKKLKVGIVGTGGMAKIHTSGYMRNPEVLVNGVCSKSRELSEEFASGHWGDVSYSEGSMEIQCGYKIKNVFDDYIDMAHSDQIDAVSIVTPNALHYEIAMEMLKNHKHVLVEKPMALSAAQAKKMVDAAYENDVVIATGHMWRYHKDVEFIRQFVQSGELGDIVQTKAYSEHLRWAPGGWFASKKDAGGGALMDMGVHAIDTMRYILGDPLIKSVYANVGTRFTDAEVDDFVQIMIKHCNGTVSLIESGWNLPHISGPEAATEIWGTKGYARLFPTEVEYKKFGQWVKVVPEPAESHTSVAPYNRQIDEFAATCLGKGKCRVAYEVGYDVVRICDAAYLSAKDDVLVRFNE